MLVDLGSDRFYGLIVKVRTCVVKGHRVGLVVDKQTDLIVCKCIVNLLIRGFTLSHGIVVDNEDESAHFVTLLDKIRLRSHAFFVDLGSTEYDIEA